MGVLDIWDKPELFEQFDFSLIDKKVNFIENYRRKNSTVDSIIRELNNRIDIDYIKDSEYIEGQSNLALEGISYDEDYEELYETAKLFATKSKNPDIEDFYLGKYKTILKNGRLVIYRKDPETGEIRQFRCNMPTHLQVLKDTLSQARKDKIVSEGGEMPEVKTTFIEKIHERLFKDYIQINTRLNRDPKLPPITPEGYGRFRKTIFINGHEHKYNVEVDGAGWQPTDSDHVQEEMEQLVQKYNSSTLHPIMKAIIFKACFVRIHPFRDGNGRTSRILLNYMLVRNGIPTVTIRGVHKQAYFDALDTAINDEDYTQLIKMVKIELNQRCAQYMNIINRYELERRLDTVVEDVDDLLV